MGSVVSYCLFWIAVTVALVWMRIDERRVAHGKGKLWVRLRGKKVGEVQVNGGTGLVLTTDSKRVNHAEEIAEVERNA